MKPTFHKEAGAAFQWGCSRLVRGGEVDRHPTSTVRGGFSDSEGGGTGSFPRTIDRLHEEDMMISGMDEGSIVGRMTRAMRLEGEDADEEQRLKRRKTAR